MPKYLGGYYVSNEYTILRAPTPEEALFYLTVMRSKEILGDILTFGTGLNRGRIHWNEMSKIEVPQQGEYVLSKSVQAVEQLWKARQDFYDGFHNETEQIATVYSLNDESARQRWLSYKPTE